MSNPFMKDPSWRQKAAQQRNVALQPATYKPQIPFSSPVPDDQRSVRSTNTYQTHNPFISPNPSQTPSVGEETDSTYGQDEFPLERYSQSTNNDRSRYAERVEKTDADIVPQVPEDPQSKRLRPGLNIITDLHRSDGRSMTDGLVVEQVQASRPKLGRKYVTSVASQKVEHDFQTSQFSPPQPSGFVNLNDLAKLRQQDREKIRQENGKNTSEPAGKLKARTFGWRKGRKQSDEIDVKPMNGVSPGDRSIVIGISVPRDEADAHQPKAGDSALTIRTPGTPTIVITPAEPGPDWAAELNSDKSQTLRRPTSSVYSRFTNKDGFYTTTEVAPPLPSMKDRDHAMQPRVTERTGNDFGGRNSTQSFETIFDEEMEPTHLSRPRSTSTGSQKQMLSSGSDSARPKSKGWWNLMFSPVLSRTGTQKTLKSSEGPEVPVIPAHYQTTPYDQDDEGSLDENAAPQTPRRMGIGIESVDGWPSWSEWEQARGNADVRPQEQDPPQSKALNPEPGVSSGVPFTMAAKPSAKGLAEEYFYACAVDEGGGGPYFPCENHSCSEKLPCLGFVAMEKGELSPITREINPATDEKLLGRHVRSGSDSTVIDDEHTEFSPNVRVANKAPIGKARALEKAGKLPEVEVEESGPLTPPPAELAKPSKTPGPPAYSPARTISKPRNLATILPPQKEQQQPLASPGPISPGMQQAMAPPGAVPMNTVYTREVIAPIFFTSDTRYPDLPAQTSMAPVSFTDLGKPAEKQEKIEARRQRHEKEDEVARKAGGLWRGRGCFPKNGCFGRGGREGRTKRRVYIGVAGVLLAVVIACVVVATQFTRKADATPVQSQWLNLTGFPPMPTGISTIAQPDAVTENSGCVQPASLWSCAVPKEDQASIAPNDPDQPNFRFEIRFRNGTVPNNETIPLSRRSRFFSRKHLVSRQNDPFTNALFTPSPAAPSIQEQIFLGNTTDNITLPFDGEETPFFMTFLPTNPVLPPAYNTTTSSTLQRRQSSTTNTTTSNSNSINLPPAALAPDGTAAPANLLPNSPLPDSQPIRLYNRGTPTEHYGFYTYFDRGLFMHSAGLINDSSAFAAMASDPADQNGGALKSDATMRCTWSQTRFLIKIWTSPAFGAALLGSPPSPGSSVDNIPASSATDFSVPGSFPYPVSVTLDRHGGAAAQKGVYCYGVDTTTGDIIESEKALVFEARGFGGVVVNPAPGLVQVAGEGNGFNASAGGVDGGTGGCACEWQNWIGVS